MPDTLDINTLPIDVIMNTVLDGLITINETGHIQSFNLAAERIFQYTPEEVIGKNVSILMPNPYHSEHDQYLSNYLRSGNRKVIGIGREVKAQRKDGSIFPMELGVNEMSVEGKRMFVGTIRDISDRKRAEQNLISETNQLQAVLRTVLDGLITIDKYGHIRSFNPAAETVFGYSQDEVIGQNVKMLMPNPYHSEHDQYLSNYMTTGEKKVIGIGRKVMAKRKDGTVFPIELGVNEMDIEGETMYVGTIRDITERIEAEEAIESYIEQLTRSNQELDDFAYIASHDLKEPLRGLSNNALFLEEDYSETLDDAGKKRIHRMKFLCNRLERLVDDLLYYSRLGRQELAIQATDFNNIIGDIALTLESTLRESNTEIIIPEPLPALICDLPRITEVLRNLITNAIKYNNRDKKTIEITYQEEMQVNDHHYQHVFSIKDNGIGIDETFYNDVFRIFKRLNSEDDNVKGTGVGLTFVKKIIERHKGKLWLESKLGQGTTFFFNLPQQEERA